MKGLTDLIGRIKDSLDKDASTRESIANCIKEELGFDLRLEDISIKGGQLRIQTSPAKKNEIKLNETRVLEKIRVRTKLNIQNITY